MSNAPSPAPLAINDMPTWVDVAAVTADVLQILRMSASDPDAARVSECILTAATLIDCWLDRAADPLPPAPPMHPLAQFGTAQVSVELFRRKDAPFGVLNAWSPDEVVTRISNDPIRGSFNILLPLKGGWGVA